MKVLFCNLLFSILALNAASQTSILEYGQEVTIIGEVKLVTYETPGGLHFNTYILKLENSLTIAAESRDDKAEVFDQVHLNHDNGESQLFNNTKSQVVGTLFKAVTFHHIRNVCIRVKSIEEKKSRI